ncbi:phosphate transport system protein [Halohasta litchfieldiae]|jgi:phosphate uptake regulator, PhoU|uniref:Phosphate-specific transport system accessory protein PhoU n=1 Tax=Halohasta litchfieldiae TaxID=1073996 RepID=A0A1H6RDU3_9EURY|nr:phosphate signaling complex protein PhoU [Halohasta litchfieldiae]ATW89704.1 phosphate transport system protein [Halohasta litchfieldiae]SEI53971.1 phosphate uptake regulator, PhoU [Halohasta litchfieldiae]
MARVSYQHRLDTLREDVLYMSELVIDRLRLALTALEGTDESLAHEVINGDNEINDLYLDLEGDCIDLVALQQPVASDLRFIAASFKIITDLERIGDLAVNLAEYSLSTDRIRFPDVDIQTIGSVVTVMVEDAMRTYAEADRELCYELEARDDSVDQQCETASEAVVRDLLARDESTDVDLEGLLADISRLLLTVRDLERIGDHAVNIASRSLYMIQNDADLLY